MELMALRQGCSYLGMFYKWLEAKKLYTMAIVILLGKEELNAYGLIG